MQHSLPKRYAHLISSEDYQLILSMSLGYLSSKMEVERIDDGVIYVKRAAYEPLQCALDNLVRSCSQETNKEMWFEMICAHFEKIMIIDQHPDLSYFDNVRKILSIRIYPQAFGENMGLSGKLVTKTDFEGTISVLVLDLPGRFQLLTKRDVTVWNKSDGQLFEIAQQNVNKQQIDVAQHELAGEFELFSFFNSDYAASYAIDFEQNAHFAIGKYGTLVAVPSKGVVFAHPIKNEGVIVVIQMLHPLVTKFYNEEPGNITYNYFWYFDKKFYAFPAIAKEDYITFSLPKPLEQLLKQDCTINKNNLN